MTKLFLSVLLLGIGFAARAQNTPDTIPQEFPKRYPDSWLQERIADQVFTDTLSYELPNNGVITIVYNSAEYSETEIDEKLRESVSEAVEFPAGKQLIYHMIKRFRETDLQNLFMLLNTKYAVKYNGHSLVLGLPTGLSYTGGHFTPMIGARLNFHVPRYTFGFSIDDIIRFEDKVDEGVRTEHNLFLNAEFGYSGRELYPENFIQIGLLLNHKNSALFEGTTLKATYKYKLGKIVYLQAGLIATRDIGQIYPIFGISIF